MLSAGFRFRGKRYNPYLTTKIWNDNVDAVCCSPPFSSQRERLNCGLLLWNNSYDRNVIGSKSCRRGDEFLGVLKVNLKSSKRIKISQHGDTSIFELTTRECGLKHLNFVSDTFQLTFVVVTTLSFHLWFISPRTRSRMVVKNHEQNPGFFK